MRFEWIDLYFLLSTLLHLFSLLFSYFSPLPKISSNFQAPATIHVENMLFPLEHDTVSSRHFFSFFYFQTLSKVKFSGPSSCLTSHLHLSSS